jgi:adenine-specific DNA-methyltransferase
MVDVLSSDDWGRALGLAVSPLFAQADAPPNGSHSLLLNGADGCVAFSAYDDRHDNGPFLDWAWSCGVLHHLSAFSDRIVVRRWDTPNDHRSYRASSVASQIRDFYGMLSRERSRATTTLDQHAVDIFRRLRSDQAPAQAIGMFLFLLAAMLDNAEERAIDAAADIIERHRIENISVADIRRPGARFWVENAARFRHPSFAYAELTTLPNLVVRHAGSRIFQEAHFDLLRAGERDLFDYAAPATVSVVTRGGVHFTPPGIARSLTEQAAARVANRRAVTVLDPACGSGAFLLEAARFFRLRNPDVQLHLIGFDLSPFAAAMARFALANLKRDWGDGIEFDVHIRDSLGEEPWPAVDLILTNPPFIAWPDLSREQQRRLRELLGSKVTTGPQRPDISMAFVTRAVAALANGGVLGSLLPGGVLSMHTATSWRKELLENAQANLIVFLGEHGLFEYATVEVAAIVLTRNAAPTDCISLWASQRRGASAEALRELRRQGQEIRRAADEKQRDWSIYRVSADQLREGVSWRPRPYRLAAALEIITKTISTRVGDLYHIRQGVRTGHRDAFIVEAAELSKLSEPEQKYFRPVVENDNIRDARIIPGPFIFYPDTEGLPKIDTERDLSRLLPNFFERLVAFRSELEKRKGAKNWWSLTRPRGWLRKPRPKLVSAYFGQSGSFSFDRQGNDIIVQGHGWIETPSIDRVLSDLVVRAGGRSARPLSYEKTIAPAYVALLNSSFFESLLREFCPTVGGGQCNLSAIFVDRIPLPNLAELALPDSEFERHVGELAKFGTQVLDGEGFDERLVTDIVREIYGARVP